jgi:thiol-disulfide isomerase/thioredoxin
MQNHNRPTAHVLCVFAILLTVQAAYSSAEEAKSYPVLSGVGIALKVEGGHLLVGGVIPDSPADKSGAIHPGDRLTSVDADGKQTSLKDKTVGEAASLIRGPVGTELTLSLTRQMDDELVNIRLKRAPLELEGVSASTYERFVGKPVPDLELSSLDGTSIENLSDHRGKVIVLDFWSSWCATCYQPVTKLQRIAAEHPEWADKVELITVTVDADLSSAVAAIDKQKWYKTRNLAVDLDDLKGIGVSVVPVAIIIAKDGTVANMAGSHALDFEKEIASQLAH